MACSRTLSEFRYDPVLPVAVSASDWHTCRSHLIPVQDRIVLLLKGSPEPLSAGEIAAKLNSTKREVNAALYSFQKSGVVQQIWHTSHSAPFWSTAGSGLGKTNPRRDDPVLQPKHHPPDQTPLYRWQEEAFRKWQDNGYRGTIAAVTGSGKTRFALEAAKRLGEV